MSGRYDRTSERASRRAMALYSTRRSHTVSTQSALIPFNTHPRVIMRTNVHEFFILIVRFRHQHSFGDVRIFRRPLYDELFPAYFDEPYDDRYDGNTKMILWWRGRTVRLCCRVVVKPVKLTVGRKSPYIPGCAGAGV